MVRSTLGSRLSVLVPSLWLCSQAAATAAPAGAASATPTIAACETVDCLDDVILRDKSQTPSAAACKALDGRLDTFELKHDNQRDLGPVCRLLVARRASARRAVAPCMDRDSMAPDWDPVLEDKYSMEIQNILLSEAPLRRRGMTAPPATAGFNNSTIFGTYVFDRGFGSAGKRVSFATYFCIADSPRRYVPYYYILRVNDEIVDAQIVTKPIDVPVLRQAAKFKHEDDQRTFLLVDLNGDRKKDVVILRNHGSSKSYTLAACLYDAKGADCTPVASEPMVIDQIAPKLRLSATPDGTVVVSVSDAFDEPLGDWRFRVAGTQLKTVARPSGGPAAAK